MSTLNLGFKVPDYGKMQPTAAPESSSAERATKIDYPSLTIPGNLGLAQSLRAGQEFTATVKFRVSEVAIRDRDTGEGDGDKDECVDQYGGTRVELDAVSMDIQGIKVKEESGEQDGASAIQNYFNKKKTADSEEE